MFQGKHQWKIDSFESHKGSGSDPFINEQCISRYIHTIKKAAGVLSTANNLFMTQELKAAHEGIVMS